MGGGGPCERAGVFGAAGWGRRERGLGAGGRRGRLSGAASCMEGQGVPWLLPRVLKRAGALSQGSRLLRARPLHGAACEMPAAPCALTKQRCLRSAAAWGCMRLVWLPARHARPWGPGLRPQRSLQSCAGPRRPKSNQLFRMQAQSLVATGSTEPGRARLSPPPPPPACARRPAAAGAPPAGAAAARPRLGPRRLWSASPMHTCRARCAPPARPLSRPAGCARRAGAAPASPLLGLVGGGGEEMAWRAAPRGTRVSLSAAAAAARVVQHTLRRRGARSITECPAQAATVQTWVPDARWMLCEVAELAQPRQASSPAMLPEPLQVIWRLKRKSLGCRWLADNARIQGVSVELGWASRRREECLLPCLAFPSRMAIAGWDRKQMTWLYLRMCTRRRPTAQGPCAVGGSSQGGSFAAAHGMLRRSAAKRPAESETCSCSDTASLQTHAIIWY
jgi:hypothetical protein